MKKIYFLAGALVGTFTLNAQIVTTNSLSAKKERGEILAPSKKVSNSLKAEGDVYWTNQFENAAEWVQTDGTGHTGGDWSLLTALPSNVTSQQADYLWPTAFTGATGNFAFINSDAAGDAFLQDAYYEFQGDIALATEGAGSGALYVTFAEYYRNFYDQTFIEVSNDGGLTWTTFEANPESEVPVNTNCVDGEVEVVNITSAMTNGAWSDEVRIRFHYIGDWDWFWGIDDVQIVAAWDNDIKLNTYYQSTDVLTTQALDYYYIPQSQASYPGMTFGAWVTNNGGADQASVQLNVTATGGYNQSSTAVGIDATMMDSLSISTPYIPTGLGTKTINLTTVIPGTDSELSNNQESFEMYMTEYEYSRDNNIATGSISQVLSQEDLPLQIGNVMEIFDDMTVSAVKIRLATQGNGAVGAEFFGVIYKYDFDLQDWTYVDETSLGVITNTTAKWDQLPLLGGPITFTAGDVLLVVAGHTGGVTEVRFGMAQNTTEGTVLGFTADGEGFQLTTPGAVMVRLLDEPLAVSELANNFGMSVYPNPTNTTSTLSFALNNESDVTVSVTDLTGKVVFTNALGTVNGTQKVNLDTQALSNGAYMVNLTVNGVVSTQKLIVRK